VQATLDKHSEFKLDPMRHPQPVDSLRSSEKQANIASIPSQSVSGFARVESIKILDVTFSRKFSVSQHVDELLASCAQSLFALRTLRQHHHGLPTEALHAVF